MSFEFTPQSLDGVVLIRPRVFHDARGYLLETWRRSAFEAAGIRDDFCQVTHSYSEESVLRGIHYQLPPHAQGKLVRVVEGHVFDVCVDLRKRSATFGQWLGAELTGTGHEMLYLPPGFGHAFLVLSKGAHFLYHSTGEYRPDAEAGIRWDDPDLDIQWPTRRVRISDKDEGLPHLANAHVFEGEGPWPAEAS